MYANWVAIVDENDTTNFWLRINNIDSNLNGIFWKDVIWDNAKKVMKRVTEKFIRNYFSYLLGGKYDESYTYITYNKQIGIEGEENYKPLPDSPN